MAVRVILLNACEISSINTLTQVPVADRPQKADLNIFLETKPTVETQYTYRGPSHTIMIIKKDLFCLYIMSLLLQ